MDVADRFDPETTACPTIGNGRLSRAVQEATAAVMAVPGDLGIADIARGEGPPAARIDASLAGPEPEAAP